MQSGKEIGSHKTCLTADKYTFTEFVGIFKDKWDNMRDMAFPSKATLYIFSIVVAFDNASKSISINVIVKYSLIEVIR